MRLGEEGTAVEIQGHRSMLLSFGQQGLGGLILKEKQQRQLLHFGFGREAAGHLAPELGGSESFFFFFFKEAFQRSKGASPSSSPVRCISAPQADPRARIQPIARHRFLAFTVPDGKAAARTGAMAQLEDALEMPTLGRPFQLGMLYDCRKDALIPGFTLWNEDAVQEDLNVQPLPNTESKIIASDSLDDKASALDISSSLKTSILGGLIDMRGSARYLLDAKMSRRQARVTLHYRTTVRSEGLAMHHLGIQNISHPEIFDHGMATHVVVAILYGAQAFFVFDRDVSSSNAVQEAEGSLKAIINKIISVEEEEEKNMDDKEKSQAEKFRCTFYGDFSLESNPVSFQDAMQVFSTLPKMMGDDGDKAVPIKVWLYPLTKMDSKAAEMVQEISLGLIWGAQKVLEDLDEIDMRCSDLGKNPIANTFPEIKKKIQHFKDLCKQHRQTFQKKMARILPSIRGGKKEEGALAKTLTLMNQSLFNIQSLHGFLDTKEEEIQVVKSFLTILKGIEIISSQVKLEEIVLDPKSEFVVSFTFTSLHNEEPFLSHFQHCLQKRFLQVVDDLTRTRSTPEKLEVWFDHEDVLQNAWNAARSTSDFAHVNKPSGKTRFVVASAPDEDNPGASVYLYKDGELISCNFQLPKKPFPLLVDEIKHDSMKLVFQPATYGRHSISSYQVEYKPSGEEKWKVMQTQDNHNTAMLQGLCPNTKYLVRYCARSKPGLSKPSDINRPVKTLPTSPPGKPREVTVGSSLISVTWGSPSVIGAGAVIKEYQVEYRVEGEDDEGIEEWNERRTGRKTEFCQIDGLRPQSLYRLRVSAVCADGAQSAPSEEVEVSTTREEEEKDRIAFKYLQKSSLAVKGQPSIYVLPLEATSNTSTSCLKYCLGEKNLKVPNKVIMMIGATGSGKTTLINGMTNYILGVQWEDEFRFKLIHEETHRSQAESQPSNMKVYALNYQEGFQIPYSLTIIDTPGGIEHNLLLTKEIRHFLSTLPDTDHLDAICLVLQASLSCLTPAQRYMFDSVLSSLGKDMKDHIQVLVTFADGQTPPVLEAIEAAHVPCAKDASGTPVHFKFNNSALFADNTLKSGGSCNFDEMFWKMGCMSMKVFFDSSYTLETKGLTLTKKVLRERKDLEAVVESLQPQIQAGLLLREELRKTQEALNQQKDKMAANKQYEYEVEETVPVKEDILGTRHYAINCKKCHFTCHYPCTSNNEEEKRHCPAINPITGKCKVCPGQCRRDAHSIQKHQFQYKVVKERKINEELKRKYEEACKEEQATEKELQCLIQKYEKMRRGLEGLIQKSSNSLQRLQEIALRPSPLSAPEYVDLLIMSEQQELRPGHQEWIESLKRVKDVAELIQKMIHKEPLLPGEGDLYGKTELKKQPPPKTKPKPQTHPKAQSQPKAQTQPKPQPQPERRNSLAAIASWFK
ncbi:uncharacterized protein [Anolis sagrei]|uniref:uncharacterized protein n=1 Tax=Anolis sagrei TaxID=38937 RepID=UPI0035202C11